MKDKPGVKEHDGSQLAGLSVNVFDLLVVLLDAKHQLKVILTDVIQNSLIQS